MASMKDLALAARNKPPYQICHHAVLYWLEKAGFLPKGRAQAVINSKEPVGVLVAANRYNDTLVRQSDLGSYGRKMVEVFGQLEGYVLGFYAGNTLWHSMVTLGEYKKGQGWLAGVNNAGVCPKAGTLYRKLPCSDLSWSADGNTIGLNGYRVYVATPEVVAARCVV